jgi:hypothetical protein
MNPSDVFRFVLALALLPPILRIGRGIRFPLGRKAFLFGVVYILVGVGMQAVGPLVVWTGFKLLRHLVFAAGGFSLAWAAWAAGRETIGATKQVTS